MKVLKLVLGKRGAINKKRYKWLLKTVLCFLLVLIGTSMVAHGQRLNQAELKAMHPEALIRAWENAGRKERRLIEDALIDNLPSSLPALRGAVFNDSLQVRLFACAMLAEMRDKDSVDTLLAATYDSNEKVRTRAVSALRVIGNRKAAHRVRQLIQTTQNRSVLKVSLAALGKLGSSQDVLLIRSFLFNHDEHVQTIAAGGLAILGNKEGQDILLTSTRSLNPLAQKTATFALGYLNSSESQKRLLEILKEPAAQWKSYAVIALAQQDFAAKSPQDQVEHLGELAQSRDRVVVKWAMEQLIDLDTPEATKMLYKLEDVDKEGRLGKQARRLLKIKERR